MEKIEIKNIKQKFVADIICDVCGKSCLTQEGEIPILEFMKLEAIWGYGSGKDTQEWTAQVCEKCVDEKLQFINFKKTNYL